MGADRIGEVCRSYGAWGEKLPWILQTCRPYGAGLRNRVAAGMDALGQVRERRVSRTYKKKPLFRAASVRD